MHRINLLPAELQRDLQPDLKKLAIVLIILLFLGTALSCYFIFLYNYYSIKQELGINEKKLYEINVYANEIVSIRDKSDKQINEVLYYQKALNTRQDWSFILKDINNSLPKDMWLTIMDLTYQDFASVQSQTVVEYSRSIYESQEQTSIPSPNVLIIEGCSYSVSSVGVFINNLSKKRYCDNVLLNHIAEDNGSGHVGFKITAFLE